jgi:hypothetical protein
MIVIFAKELLNFLIQARMIVEVALDIRAGARIHLAELIWS